MSCVREGGLRTDQSGQHNFQDYQATGRYKMKTVIDNRIYMYFIAFEFLRDYLYGKTCVT